VSASDVTRADPPLLLSALALAARGWHVFPCAPGGKRPALRVNWQELATTDPGRIRTWWARQPYNIAISCGPSGLVVIDLDVPCDTRPGGALEDGLLISGVGKFAELCRHYGQPYPPGTFSVSTPSGGCHLYFTAPASNVRNSAGRLGPLIDVRADGGYVLAPGSRTGQRAYTVSDATPPAPLPVWITGLLEDGPTPTTAAQRHPAPGGTRGTAYALAALREETRHVATARPGTRNDTLNRAAFSLGQLTAAGLLPPLAVDTALASAAEQAGLTEDEARRTIRSGITAGASYPRELAPLAEAAAGHSDAPVKRRAASPQSQDVTSESSPPTPDPPNGRRPDHRSSVPRCARTG
jgi:hypothetical protein